MISPDISLQDLEVFAEVCRLRSLKEAARQMNLRVSSLSKIISRLEKITGIRLFMRSIHGMEMTPEGKSFYRSTKKVLSVVPELDFSSSRVASAPAARPRQICTIGSISFLSSKMIAAAAARIGSKSRDYRFRIVEFDHNQLMAYGLRGAFDMAVHIGPLPWTRAWHSAELLPMRWGLYGRYGHPLGVNCRQDQALSYPFVVPTGWNEVEGFLTGTDNCPVAVKDRISGNETTTAETAAEIVQGSDELTFVPEIAVRKLVRTRQVQLIKVQEWPEAERMIHFSVRSDRVPKKLFDQLKASFRQALAGE